MAKEIKDPAGKDDNVDIRAIDINTIVNSKGNDEIKDTNHTKYPCISSNDLIQGVSIQAFDGGNPNKNKGRKEEKEQGE